MFCCMYASPTAFAEPARASGTMQRLRCWENWLCFFEKSLFHWRYSFSKVLSSTRKFHFVHCEANSVLLHTEYFCDTERTTNYRGLSAWRKCWAKQELHVYCFAMAQYNKHRKTDNIINAWKFSENQLTYHLINPYFPNYSYHAAMQRVISGSCSCARRGFHRIDSMYLYIRLEEVHPRG